MKFGPKSSNNNIESRNGLEIRSKLGLGKDENFHDLRNVDFRPLRQSTIDETHSRKCLTVLLSRTFFFELRPLDVM